MSPRPLVLAGDVGGTKTDLALFEAGLDRALAPVREQTFPSQGARSLEELVRRFLQASGSPPLRAACFGVPGVVMDGHSQATNLPWELDEVALARALGVDRVRLLNDLEAAGHGILVLDPRAHRTLQPGAARTETGTMALIAAGTGLGEAIIAWDGSQHHVLPSEGGHADFAPRSEVEAALWDALRREHGHVSYERVLSGPGLASIYAFLGGHRKRAEPAWLTARLAAGDASAAISEVALAGEDPICVEALALFVSIYGAEAGNLALKALAVGGVFIGGGIAPKILPRLTAGPFLDAFRAKGRLAPLMATFPVHVVLEPRAAVLGAAARARAL